MPRTQTTELNTAIPPQYEDEDDIDLRRFLRFLTAHWLILCGGLLAGGVIGFVVSSLAPVRYQSTATLMIVQPSIQPGGVPPPVITAATAKTLLVDPGVVSQAIDELGLNRDGISAQRFIDESLNVELVPSTSLVKLNVVLNGPTKARLAAALLASRLSDPTARTRRDVSLASVKALEKQLAEADQNLKDVEQRLLKFKSTSKFDISKLEGKEERGTLATASRALTASERTELYGAQLQLARLQTEYDARLRIYNAVLLQYEDSNRPGAGVPQLQMVTGPLQIDQPLPRNRRRYAALGGVIGLVAGILGALLMDYRGFAGR